MKKFGSYIAISLAIFIAVTICFLYFFDYLEKGKAGH